jgi:hypothetical protein
MELWELWDELPEKIIEVDEGYRLTVEKYTDFTSVAYRPFNNAPEYYLHSESAETLHEALDKMWLWWQDYEVKK